MIHDHFIEVDVQLSVASLPWFLSLHVSTTSSLEFAPSRAFMLQVHQQHANDIRIPDS